jgi:hypothetical protein
VKETVIYAVLSLTVGIQRDSIIFIKGGENGKKDN